MLSWRSYFFPMLAAILLHALLLWLFTGGLQFSSHKSVLAPVNVVQASLVTLQKPSVQKPKIKKPVVKKKQPVKPKPSKKLEKKPVEKSKPKQKEIIKEKPSVDLPVIEDSNTLLDDLLADEDRELAELDAQNAIAQYSAAIKQTIINRWSRPPSARNNMQALLIIQLVPTGEVVSVRVKESSGNTAFDRSAILAVEKVGRFDFLQGISSRLFEQNFRQIEVVFKPEDLRL